MYRLLIVDDESHIVEWLNDLFNLENPYDFELEISKCYNGIDALNFLKETRMDVILLDIKMPGLNGLEVAEYVAQNWPSTHIIFLTGHNSFDYIYKAQKNKHITYLLKTESDENILNAVKNAIDSIEMDRQNVAIINEQVAKQKTLNHLLERNLLKGLVKQTSLSEVQRLNKWYNGDFHFNIDMPVHMIYTKIISTKDPYSTIDDNKHLLRLINLIEQLISNEISYSFLDSTSTQIVWFFQKKESNSTLDITNYLTETIDQFVQTCHNKFLFKTLFILYPKPIKWEKVYVAYEKLHFLANHHSITQNFQSFSLIWSNKEEKLYQNYLGKLLENMNTKDILRQLSIFLQQGEKNDFMLKFELLQPIYSNVNSMHYFPLIEIYQRISLMLITYINHHLLTEKIATHIGLYPLYYIHDFSNWNDAFDYLKKCGATIFDLVTHENIDHTQQLVNDIQNYILSNLKEAPTLTQLSKVFNYNASYISRIFKQKTGLNISQFIAHNKIEKAKDLLLKTDKTIETISKDVGFDNSKYFFCFFKKQTGISPGDFRRK